MLVLIAVVAQISSSPSSVSWLCVARKVVKNAPACLRSCAMLSDSLPAGATEFLPGEV